MWTHDKAVAPLVDPASQKRAAAVHVFGKTWDLAASDYETRTFAGGVWGFIKSKIGAIFAVTVVTAAMVAAVVMKSR